MDFFDHQDQARKRTGYLVAMFVLAVACIVVLTYTALMGAWVFMQLAQEEAEAFAWPMMWQPRAALAIGAGVVALVALGSLVKVAQIAHGGGAYVAEQLGGRLLNSDTTDPGERKLLNVVEEMAIASGTAVPPVYLLDDEEAINAFAAGNGPGDAVIGVTRGSVDRLNREELQGVIAHEFSHVLHGDTKLNIRLIGVLHGILLIGLLGQVVMRMTFYGAAAGSHSRRRSSNREGGGGAAVIAILAAGVALLIIGYVGVFFGNLIKAAVSRQREFLADAAAVQFTRLPDGIAGALKKIGGLSSGARLQSSNAQEASHLFFGQGVPAMAGLLATHPPLEDRIKRIQPSFEGDFPDTAAFYDKESTGAAAGVSQMAAGGGAAVAEASESAREAPESPAEQRPASRQPEAVAASAMSLIGNPTPEHAAYVGQVLRAIPGPLREAAREAYDARAVVFALMLDADEQIRQKQVAALQARGDAALMRTLSRLLPSVEKLERPGRLPLIDMTLPALRQLTPRQYGSFREDLSTLIKADGRIELFEWVLRRIVVHHLDPHFTDEAPARAGRAASLSPPIACLLSTLAYVGHRDEATAKRAFEAGMAHLPKLSLRIRPAGQCGLDALDAALDQLEGVRPRVKKQLLLACAACISADAKVTANEAELMRGIADALDCPMPPLLPGQPLV